MIDALLWLAESHSMRLVPQCHLRLVWVTWPHLRSIVSTVPWGNKPSHVPFSMLSSSFHPLASPSSSGNESESEFSGGRVGAVLVCALLLGRPNRENHPVGGANRRERTHSSPTSQSSVGTHGLERCWRWCHRGTQAVSPRSPVYLAGQERMALPSFSRWAFLEPVVDMVAMAVSMLRAHLCQFAELRAVETLLAPQ